MPYRKLPGLVDSLSGLVVSKTYYLTKTKRGLYTLRIIVALGPLFFIPTVYEVWVAENIDAFRTITWPLMLSVHIAAFIMLSCGDNDWCIRLCTLLWFVVTLLIVIAIVIR